jgi:hypothetical protein
MCQLTSGRVAYSSSECDGQQDGGGRFFKDERRQRQVGDVGGHGVGGDAAGNRNSWLEGDGERVLFLLASLGLINRVDRKTVAARDRHANRTMTLFPRPKQPYGSPSTVGVGARHRKLLTHSALYSALKLDPFLMPIAPLGLCSH